MEASGRVKGNNMSNTPRTYSLSCEKEIYDKVRKVQRSMSNERSVCGECKRPMNVTMKETAEILLVLGLESYWKQRESE